MEKKDSIRHSELVSESTVDASTKSLPLRVLPLKKGEKKSAETYFPPFPKEVSEGRRIRQLFNLSWFTLVELIVVITILTILGTIAFLNLGSFQGSARDSARISDLTNILKGLDLVFVKNGLFPAPDASEKKITITASGTLIGYQWYAGSNVLSQIKMGTAQDPFDKKYYTYLTNANATKYQLLALFEDSSTMTFHESAIPWIERTYAATYDTRYPNTKGSQLGVLLGTGSGNLNQPIQET